MNCLFVCTSLYHCLCFRKQVLSGPDLTIAPEIRTTRILVGRLTHSDPNSNFYPDPPKLGWSTGKHLHWTNQDFMMISYCSGCFIHADNRFQVGFPKSCNKISKTYLHRTCVLHFDGFISRLTWMDFLEGREWCLEKGEKLQGLDAKPQSSPPGWLIPRKLTTGTWKSPIWNLKIIWTKHLHDFGFKMLVFGSVAFF